jgi:hypothetical protein
LGTHAQEVLDINPWKPEEQKIITQSFNFSQFCEYSGGQIAQILNEEDQIAIETFLEVADPSGSNYFWIRLTDLFQEGSWMWEPSHVPLNFTNWALAQPDNWQSRQHYGALVTAQMGRTWDDVFIDADNYIIFALCQFQS